MAAPAAPTSPNGIRLSDEWKPGIYTVQLFVGEEFVISGRFLVEGIPPTVAASLTPSVTLTTTASQVGQLAPLAPAIPSLTPTTTGASAP